MQALRNDFFLVFVQSAFSKVFQKLRKALLSFWNTLLRLS